MFANGRGNYIGNTKQAGVLTKQNRKYKYTEEQIIFGRTATSEEIAKRYKKSKTWACQHRWAMRTGFSWLKEGYTGKHKDKL